MPKKLVHETKATVADEANASPANGRYHYATLREGREILDRQARKYLGMSGDEFARRYRSGKIDDPDRSDVIRVAMLLPLAGQ